MGSIIMGKQRQGKISRFMWKAIRLMSLAVIPSMLKASKPYFAFPCAAFSIDEIPIEFFHTDFLSPFPGGRSKESLMLPRYVIGLTLDSNISYLSIVWNIWTCTFFALARVRMHILRQTI